MSRPNIVFLFSDQHRADWMSCAEAGGPPTPALDALSSAGVRFANAYCPAPLCGPSRMAMLTGRRPSEIGVFHNEHVLSSGVPTFVHALGMAGYETVLCGRMHFMGPDQRHGYQKRFVGDICRNYEGAPKTHFGPYEGAQSFIYDAFTKTGPGDNAVLQYDDDVVRTAEAFLRSRAEQPTSAPPLFLTVGLYGPHMPYVAPEQHYRRAGELNQLIESRQPDDTDPHRWVENFLAHQRCNEATEQNIIEVRRNYAGMVIYLDELVARVVDAARAMPGETLFVYASDHGEMAGDRRMFGKVCHYEASARVPLIFTPLGSVSALDELFPTPGRKLSCPVSLLDLGPTLVSLVDGEEMPGQEGIDLCGLLRNPEKENLPEYHERAVFSELHIGWTGPTRMMRRGRYKLVYYHGHEHPQLFDLQADPGEQRDLSRERNYREVRRSLLDQLLSEWRPEHVDAYYHRQMADLQFLGSWGRSVGMGPLELWDKAMPGQRSSFAPS